MIDREQTLAAYERAWAQYEEPVIRAELERCCTQDSIYVSPLTDVIRGVDGLTGLILDFPVMFPGAQVRPTSTPDVHHDVAYFTWRLSSTTRIRTMGHDYGHTLDGVDFLEFDDDGRIRRITAFFGVDHPAPRDASGSDVPAGNQGNRGGSNGAGSNGAGSNGAGSNGAGSAGRSPAGRSLAGLPGTGP